MPFKNDAIELRQFDQEREVQTTKAANTIFHKTNGNWSLANTDIYGIEKTIEFLVGHEQEFDILLLGGGGAASSAIYAGQNNLFCNQIFCVTRDPVKSIEKFALNDRTQKLELCTLNSETLITLVDHYNTNQNKHLLIINTLPLGTPDKQSNNSAVYLLEKLNNKERLFYFDMITMNTQSIQVAQSQGIKNTNGQLMLEAQARKSFCYWTGIKPE